MFRCAQMIVVGVLAVSTAVFAHIPEDEVRNTVQFPAGSEPTIDGDCSDWDAVPGDQYWLTNADLYPFNDWQPEGTQKGDADPSSFDATIRVGWSASTGQLYYCNSIFDDVHVIDRPDSYDWYNDDCSEYFFTTRHLSEQEVRDLNEESIHTYWGFNYALPRLPDPDAFWMVIGICIGCDWLTSSDNEFYTLMHSFDGEEFGESTYHYEHRIQPIDHWLGGLDAEDKSPAMITTASLSEGQTIHITFFNTDDDANLPDGAQGGPAWSTRPGGSGTWLGQGDFFLEPVNPSINFPTAVESNSWGRIKAQF